MSGENKATQHEIDQTWSMVWKKQGTTDVSRVLQTRLTVEGFQVLRKYMPDGKRKILEIGTGTGRFGLLLARDLPRSTVIMSDILPESLQVARQLGSNLGLTNILFQEEDAKALSSPSDAFDIVFSDAVLQHIPDEEVAWKEMARVVKPGGTVIVSVVNRWNPHTLFKRLQGGKYHYGFERSYSHRDLAHRANSAGLTVTARDGFFPAYGITRLARRHLWVKPLGRLFDRVCRAGDRLTKRWISRIFGFEIVVVAQKPVNSEE